MNNQSPDLSPEARRIINAARGADDPTSEDQARVKTRWLAGVAAVAGVSSLTEAARAAGGVGWGLKAVGAAVALVAGAVGLYVALPDSGGEHPAKSPPAWAGRTHERHEKMVTSPQRGEVQVREVATASKAAGEPSAGAPRVADPSVNRGEPEVMAAAPALAPAIPPGAAEAVPNAPAASPALDVPADRPAVDVSARPVRERAVASRAVQPRTGGARAVPVVAVPQSQAVPPATAAASPSGQLGEELTLLSRVRSSVQDGAPQRALELLADYEARFGQAILAMEADALRVDALCQAGQREAAQASAAAFQNEWPGSPLGRRVSAACP